MARKPHAPAEIHANLSPLPENHPLVEVETEIKDIETDAAFEAARALGRMEGLEFAATVADRARVEIYLELRNNRAYRALTYKDAEGKARRVADLDEFCEYFLGKSARRVQELAAHYHLMGAELFEISQRIGFRNQDYRALKALPAEDQEVIKQAMQPESNRDQILDLLQEMAARHASEKTQLTAKAKEAEDTAEARSEVIATKERVINTLQEDLHKARRRLETQTPDQVGEQLRQETAGTGYAIVGRINTDLAEAFKALDEHGKANDCTHDDFMSGLLLEIDTALLVIRERHAVKARPDGDQRPDWMKHEDEVKAKVADMKAEMAARAARRN